eukprot:TRINITY_DN869_c0_g1_i1.p1 TRINITY_DN869_c0_g1~~TRINITY_DN869_c0_g1_i1.p1  ORF type:complete len:170 (-),score=39.59 TRINITY_DN869_c0_g1_i1:330-839(-)
MAGGKDRAGDNSPERGRGAEGRFVKERATASEVEVGVRGRDGESRRTRRDEKQGERAETGRRRLQDAAPLENEQDGPGRRGKRRKGREESDEEEERKDRRTARPEKREGRERGEDREPRSSFFSVSFASLDGPPSAKSRSGLPCFACKQSGMSSCSLGEIARGSDRKLL